MATIKYFSSIPKWVVGIILILGSMVDAVSILNIIQNHKILAVVCIALRAGIHEFDKLYHSHSQIDTISKNVNDAGK